MGLLDAMLPMNLLSRAVMQQNYYIALRGDTPAGASQPLGSGTWDDPWDGSTQLWFDWAMSQLPANATVYLGPCQFDSNGNPTKVFQTKGSWSGGGSWQPKSGQRIVGAGQDTTIIQMAGFYGSDAFYAIGWDPSLLYVNGYEITSLTIDCNLSGSPGMATGGIRLNGRNILIKDVTVKNFGNNGFAGTNGIGIFLGGDFNSALTNAVVDSCRIYQPSPYMAGVNNVGIRLQSRIQGSGSCLAHQYCVVRNCFIQGLPDEMALEEYLEFKSLADWLVWTDYEIRGIMAEGGNGTIIENNRIFDCTYGGPYYDEGSDSGGITGDLIIRNNYYRNVVRGVSIKRWNDQYPLYTIGRMIVLDNQIDLRNVPEAIGIALDAYYDNASYLAYRNGIVRGNRIRPVDGVAAAPGLQGIKALSVDKLTMDNNWVDASTPDLSVQRGSANHVQVFNNRALDGTLQRVAVTSSGTVVGHDGELTTEAEMIYATL